MTSPRGRDRFVTDMLGDLDSAAHAAAVTGVQATFAVAGAVGILASLLVVVLMRPARAHAAREDEHPPVPQPG